MWEQKLLRHSPNDYYEPSTTIGPGGLNMNKARQIPYLHPGKEVLISIVVYNCNCDQCYQGEVFNVLKVVRWESDQDKYQDSCV